MSAGDELVQALRQQHEPFTLREDPTDRGRAAYRIAYAVLRLAAKYAMETNGMITMLVTHPYSRHNWAFHSHGNRGEDGFLAQLETHCQSVVMGGEGHSYSW